MEEYSIEQISSMRVCSFLLPDPGGEVVRDVLDKYVSLLSERNNYRDLVNELESRFDLD